MSFQWKLGPQSLPCTRRKPFPLEKTNMWHEAFLTVCLYHNSYSTKVSLKLFASFGEFGLLLRIFHEHHYHPRQ